MPAPRQQTTAASSNAAASGRSFVLLVDIIALSPEQLAEVRDAAPQFINRVGGDQRRTAVVTVGDRLRIITDFAAGDEFRSARARATTSAFTQTAAGLTAADAQEPRQRGLIDAAQCSPRSPARKPSSTSRRRRRCPPPISARRPSIRRGHTGRGGARCPAHRCQPRLYVVDRRSFRVERRAEATLRVDMEGMLCPALLKYFDSAPPTRYAQSGTASDSAAR